MNSTFYILYALICKKRKIILVLFSIIYWITAFAYSIYLGNSLRYPDERWYFEEHAQNWARSFIFSRDGVTPTAFHPPAYPIFLGILVFLGLNVTGVRLVNFLILYLTLLVLYKWVSMRSTGLAPLLVILFAFCYPVLFYTAGTLYPQTFGTFFLILAITFFLSEAFETKHAILGGFSLGLAILTIPTFSFIPILMLFFALIFQKKRLPQTMLFVIIAFSSLIPWVVRNYIVFNRFVILSTNSGINLLLGNNPLTSPNSGVNVDLGRLLITEDIEKMNEFEQNEFYTKKALEYVKKEPLRYINLYILKVINYFNFRNELATKTESSKFRDLLMLVTYYPFVALTLIRLLLITKFPIQNDEIFMLVLYLSSAFVTAIFFTRIRFRIPFDYLLIVISALLISRLVETKIKNMTLGFSFDNLLLRPFQ